ncbi:MAG: Flp pilus assembly complex ATPase component TadA [Candidatus Peribacteria bacterium]|nr:MAG: Flp pilus assembly complex ATPase component TadA [Candidatus Peribacteria bacterium]
MLGRHPGGFEKLQELREIDFNFYSQTGSPYRVNAYYKMEMLGVAMRKINYEPQPLEQLMFQDVAATVQNSVLNQKTGLFLVCGPTGSGKTTSLIAMLEVINNMRKEHIITIEDPIEYVFQPKNCLISQREL